MKEWKQPGITIYCCIICFYIQYIDSPCAFFFFNKNRFIEDSKNSLSLIAYKIYPLKITVLSHFQKMIDRLLGVYYDGFEGERAFLIFTMA